MARKVVVPQAFKDAQAKAEASNWKIEHRRKHLIWIPPTPGMTPVFTQSSQVRGRHAVSNTLALLRSRGLPV